MKKFKEEDFQIGDVFENKMGASYEIVAIDFVYVSVKYTYREIIQFNRNIRKNFECYLNQFNSLPEYRFYKVADGYNKIKFNNILEIE